MSDSPAWLSFKPQAPTANCLVGHLLWLLVLTSRQTYSSSAFPTSGDALLGAPNHRPSGVITNSFLFPCQVSRFLPLILLPQQLRTLSSRFSLHGSRPSSGFKISHAAAGGNLQDTNTTESVLYPKPSRSGAVIFELRWGRILGPLGKVPQGTGGVITRDPQTSRTPIHCHLNRLGFSTYTSFENTNL